MSTQPDLIIPRSALAYTPGGTATATAENWTTLQIGVLLQSVIEQHAAEQIGDQTLHLASVTFDASAAPVAGATVGFTSRIDRKTRTLISASGLAMQGDDNLLKATIVYRID